MYKYINLAKDIPLLSTYNVLLGIGMIVFFLSLEKVIRKNAIPVQSADEIKGITFFASIFGILGAILVEAINHRKEHEIAFSGFTFYGGLVTTILSLWVITHLKNMNFLNVANILTLPLTLAHSFGRIGCFFGGCCYGIPTNSFLGVVFPAGSLPYMQYRTQEIHPTQLYESFLLLLLAITLFSINLKWRFTVYLLSYPIIRFLIEFFRGDNRGSLLFDFLSPAQEISLLLFVAGWVILFKSIKTKSSENPHTTFI